MKTRGGLWLTVLTLGLGMVAWQGCGAGAEIKALQQRLGEEEQRRKVVEEEAALRLADLQAAATFELGAAQREAQLLLDDLVQAEGRAGKKVEAPGLVQFPTVAPERVVIQTVTRETPVVQIDGELDAVGETRIKEALDEWKQRYANTQQQVSEITAALAQAEKLVASYQDKSPLKKYGPSGIGGVLLAVIGYALGWWRRRVGD